MSSKRCPLIGIGQLDPYLIAELRDRTRMLRTVTLMLTPPTVDPLIQTPSSAVSIVESCSCTHTKTMKMKAHETAHEFAITGLSGVTDVNGCPMSVMESQRTRHKSKLASTFVIGTAY